MRWALIQGITCTSIIMPGFHTKNQKCLPLNKNALLFVTKTTFKNIDGKYNNNICMSYVFGIVLTWSPHVYSNYSVVFPERVISAYVHTPNQLYIHRWILFGILCTVTGKYHAMWILKQSRTIVEWEIKQYDGTYQNHQIASTMKAL